MRHITLKEAREMALKILEDTERRLAEERAVEAARWAKEHEGGE